MLVSLYASSKAGRTGRLGFRTKKSDTFCGTPSVVYTKSCSSASAAAMASVPCDGYPAEMVRHAAQTHVHRFGPVKSAEGSERNHS